MITRTDLPLVRLDPSVCLTLLLGARLTKPFIRTLIVFCAGPLKPVIKPEYSLKSIIIKGRHAEHLG